MLFVTTTVCTGFEPVSSAHLADILNQLEQQTDNKNFTNLRRLYEQLESNQLHATGSRAFRTIGFEMSRSFLRAVSRIFGIRELNPYVANHSSEPFNFGVFNIMAVAGFFQPKQHQGIEP